MAGAVELQPFRQEQSLPGPEREDSVELKVSWKDLGGACEELIEYEVGSFVSAAVSTGSRKSQLQTAPSRRCSCCYKVMSAMRGCLLRAPREREEVVTLMRGYFWKLNNGVDLSAKTLSSLTNWRRRIFCLQKKAGTTVITYLSEKENGVLQLACVVQGRTICSRALNCSVTRLPRLQMQDLEATDREDLCDSMRQYDLAFSGKAMQNTYSSLVPESLQPLCFAWPKSRVENTLVMAARPELMRSWEKVLQEAVPVLNIGRIETAQLPGTLKESFPAAV
mmetsp:Transcript_40472/g.72534  ORF Transcript_40472/g.72534 Transcript_40472/m.72534 type:complete len:279 (-) Transcript_40472:94-930(-)